MAVLGITIKTDPMQSTRNALNTGISSAFARARAEESNFGDFTYLYFFKNAEPTKDCILLTLPERLDRQSPHLPGQLKSFSRHRKRTPNNQSSHPIMSIYLQPDQIRPPLITQPYIRSFDKGRDYDTLCDWWRSHGLNPVPWQILPRLGIVACDELDGDAIAAAFLHMDNSISLARIEHLVAPAGNTAAESRRAIRAVIDGLEHSARGFNYTILAAVTYPALAREAEALGWITVQKGLVNIMKGVMQNG